jgi:proton glutamate symport protein
MSPPEKVKTLRSFFDGFFEVIMRCVDIVMKYAPFGVFALLAAIVADSPSADIFTALLGYAFTILLGLAILMFVFYPVMVKFFTGRSPMFFFRGISPAQLVAFSTSSSAATLPVTMERVEEHLGVDKEVSSFVLPVGATLNMDGTCLYQGVATVFIAQALGIELSVMAQLGIILTATLASIGTAAVPGVGIIMLVMILSQAGVPEEGLALILAIDRPLDMCRTSVNVTSDAAISMVVANSMGKLGDPKPRTLGV